jgi:hypothetical protein
VNFSLGRPTFPIEKFGSLRVSVSAAAVAAVTAVTVPIIIHYQQRRIYGKQVFDPPALCLAALADIQYGHDDKELTE